MATAVFVGVGPHRHDQLVSRHAAMTVSGQELHERLGPLPAPIGNPMAVNREFKGTQHAHGQETRRVTPCTMPWRGYEPARRGMSRTGWCGGQRRRRDELVQKLEHVLEPSHGSRFALGHAFVLTFEVTQPTSQVLPLRQGFAARDDRAAQRLVTGLRRALLHLAEHAVNCLRSGPVGYGTGLMQPAVPPCELLILSWSWPVPGRSETGTDPLGVLVT